MFPLPGPVWHKTTFEPSFAEKAQYHPKDVEGIYQLIRQEYSYEECSTVQWKHVGLNKTKKCSLYLARLTFYVFFGLICWIAQNYPPDVYNSWNGQATSAPKLSAF